MPCQAATVQHAVTLGVNGIVIGAERGLLNTDRALLRADLSDAPDHGA